MLACLILVPLAAIFGSVCPEVVRSTLVEPILGPKSAPPGTASADVGPSPLTGPFDLLATPPSSLPVPAEAPAWSPAGAAVPAVQNSPAASQAHAPAAPVSGFATLTRFDAAAETSAPGRPVGSASAAAFAAPELARDPTAVSAGAVAAGAAQPAVPDRFKLLERRLREYGAIYYLLETWGSEGELYRFHCKMAIGSNPNYTRHFEATNRDALQAMSQVLEQIEAWRGK